MQIYKKLLDVKDAFEIFSKTTDLQICYDQVGDVLRALNLNPTQEDVEKILGNPSKEGDLTNVFLTILQIFLRIC